MDSKLMMSLVRFSRLLRVLGDSIIFWSNLVDFFKSLGALANSEIVEAQKNPSEFSIYSSVFSKSKLIRGWC